MIKDVDSKSKKFSIIGELIKECKKKYNEFQKRLSYLKSGNIEIRKLHRDEKVEIENVLKKLSNLIEKLDDKKEIQKIISSFSNIDDIWSFFEAVILEQVPEITITNNLKDHVESKYSRFAKVKYSDYVMPMLPESDIVTLHNKIMSTNNIESLLAGKAFIESLLYIFDYDTNKKIEHELSLLIEKIIKITMENQSKSPIDPDNPVQYATREIGESNEDVTALIKSNDYFGVLHGVKSSQIEKYSAFISTGFHLIFNNWRIKYESCKDYYEIEDLYSELWNLYKNFKDYLSKENLEMVEEYINKVRKRLEDSEDKSREITDDGWQDLDEGANKLAKKI